MTWSLFTLKLPYGIDIFYTDSGPPPGSLNYTTLLVIHGTGFNGHGFEALHALAHQENLRTVLINRRQYPGSSKYTTEEISKMSKDPEAVLDNHASCLADILVAYIEEHNIPKAAEDRSGGVAVVGWSRGSAMLVAMLSNPSRLPEGAYAKLSPYLNHIVLHDPSVIFGFGHPEKAYLPWRDTTLATAADKLEAFKLWVSSYFEPPPPDWDGRVDRLASAELKRSAHTSLDSWSEQDLRRWYNPDAALIADLPFGDPGTLKLATYDCLFNEQLARTYFPNLRVTYISCRQSPWPAVWAAFEAQRLYDECKRNGESVRPMTFVMAQHANHFLHSDNPREFLTIIKSELTSHQKTL